MANADSAINLWE